MGDNVVDIIGNLIHEEIGLKNEGFIPLNDKNVTKIIIENTEPNSRGPIDHSRIQDFPLQRDRNKAADS